MNCQQFKEMMDSYISDELLVETNHEVLHHLENCPGCRRELSARRNLRAKLRSALRNSHEMQMNPAFAARLRTGLRETVLHPKWWEISGKTIPYLNLKALLTAAVCLMFIAGAWVSYRNLTTENILVAETQSNNLSGSNTISGNEQPLQSPVTQAVQTAWRKITDFAVGDHENCTLHFRLKENPVTLEEASEKYEKFNKDVDKAVIEPQGGIS